MDRLIRSRQQGLGYRLKDQLNNRQGSLPLLSESLFCLWHCGRQAYLLQSFCSFKLTLLPILTSPFLPFHPLFLSFCTLSNLSPSPPQSISSPACCFGPIVPQLCLPSGHLAQHHSRRDFRLTVQPLAKGRQTHGQSGGKRGGGVTWPPQSVPALGDSWTPSHLLACGGQPCYHSHKDQVLRT